MAQKVIEENVKTFHVTTVAQLSFSSNKNTFVRKNKQK